jgi:hypothetical protein
VREVAGSNPVVPTIFDFNQNVSGAEACDARRLLFVVIGVLRFASHDGGENQDALLAFLDEATELVPSVKASDMACIGLLQGDEQNVVQAVAMETSNGLEIDSKRLAMALLHRSDELFGGLLVISLICPDFISVLLCGDLVPSLEPGNQRTTAAGEQKKRIKEQCAKATGVTRVREWRGGVPAGGLFVQFVSSFRAQEELNDGT